MNIKQINLNFPINQTFEYSIEDIDKIKKMNFSNYNIHLKLNMDKLMKKNFNQSALEEEVKIATKASNIKISFIYQQETNVRSKEVTDQTNIIDKWKSYANINTIKYKDSLLNKLEIIQNMMLLLSFTPHESFTLEYMSLRGAIGISDGQHKDEIEFNFADDYDEGIIGITGITGSGKTTIMENMHPYPCMLSRIGTLKEHFCLRDSHRILIYRASSGIRYRITMNICGTNDNIDPTYYVEKSDGDSWEPVTSVDSHKDSYLKWVESNFGPKELFQRTAFYSNAAIKGLPDLSQAGKTEKMQLFSILAGTDYLSVVCDEAKKAIKIEEKYIETIKGQLKDFDNLSQRQSDNEQIISENKDAIKKFSEFITKDTAELNEYTEKQKAYDMAEATFSIYRNQLKEKNREELELSKQIIQSKNNIEAFTQQLENSDLYREQLKWYEENMALRKNLISEESNLRDNLYKLQLQLDKKQSEYDSYKISSIELKNKIESIKKEITHLTNSTPDLNGKCPVCGAPLEEHKKDELRAEKEEIEKRIKQLNDNLKLNEGNLSKDLDWLSKNSLTSFKEELSNTNNKLIEISNNITEIDSYADTLNIEDIKDVLFNTQGLLDKENEAYSTLTLKREEIRSEIKGLENTLNNIPTDYSDKIKRLERGIQDSQNKIAQASAEITMAEKELERISGAEEKVKSIKEEIKFHNDNIKDYELIQAGFSNNGIQALELDSASPEIQNIANSILHETYGDRFKISFETQRETKDKRKIDDFLIYVFDADNARNKRLDFISSGEGTLIKQTLYYAFSVIRARRTGFCFRTRFLDESDSALDSELRVRYLRMIEAAHKQCNAHQTFIITHSQELKTIISQKIEL